MKTTKIHAFKPAPCAKEAGNAPITFDRAGTESPVADGVGELIVPATAFQVILSSEAKFGVSFKDSNTSNTQGGEFTVPADTVIVLDVAGFSSGTNFCDTIVLNGTADVSFIFNCYSGNGKVQ